MKFLDKVDVLTSKFPSNAYERRGNALLCELCNPQPPLATHIIFAPMTEKIIAHLVDSYKRAIPEDLLTLYRSMNGSDLFWTTRYIKEVNLHIPLCRFSIYGVPFGTTRNSIEPFNISLEDLNRPNGTPDNWLKIGAYYKPEDLSYRLDLYADTDTSYVYAVGHDNPSCCVVEKWDTIDQCLCAIFDLLEAK